MPTRLDLTRLLCFVALPLVLVACSSGKEASSDSPAPAAVDSAAGTAMQPAAGRPTIATTSWSAHSTPTPGCRRSRSMPTTMTDVSLLKGRVQSAAQRDLAGQIATREAAGITVDNQHPRGRRGRLRQRGPSTSTTSRIRWRMRIEADGTLRALDLDVDEEDGQIILEGKATAAQRAAAEALAKRFAGTVIVVNRIKVQ